MNESEYWEPDADGMYRITVRDPAPNRTLNACWNQQTGELTLSEDGREILSTYNPAAFEAGRRLLGDDGVVVFVNWAMVTRAHGPT